MKNQLTAEQELLTTKDINNVLTFPNDDYFFGEDGFIKTKYHNALQRLQKYDIIKFNWLYNGEKWCFEWVVQI